MDIPRVSRSDQIKMASAEFTGKTVTAIKEGEKGIITIEFDHGGVMIIANPAAVALGLTKEPELPSEK